MRQWRRAVALLLAGVPISALPAVSPAMNYLMHCQGCHQDDGSGQPGYVPDFRGTVARFLTLPEGRAYLGRVPGVSQSLLSDTERAAVLNWIIATFDASNVPATFTSYTAHELAVYRTDPVSQANAERDRLLRRISATTTAAPPPQFAVCAACHPTSSDGASAMGPNLRALIGRPAGSLAAFPYSAAMKASGIAWTREALDAFLTNVQQQVPGTQMAFTGIPDAADRAAVIAYLESLR
jgi:cytochrome c